MKTVLIEKPGEVRVTERNKPEPGSDELLVRVNYVGFCGSDLSTYLGKNPLVQYPRVPGHEISAVIETTGSKVPEGFSIGEPVTVIPYTSCGECSSCRQGREHACRNNQTLGVQRDGAMQEYLPVPWKKVLRVPGLKTVELAMVEPLTVGFHAVERGRVSARDIVMVMGCGMIGTGALIASVRKQATVIVLDIDDHKLDLAKDLGADHVLNSGDPELHDRLSELTGGEGPGVVIEAVGHPDTYRMAIEETSFAGRVVCIGYTPGEVAIDTGLIVRKELDVMGSRNATLEDFKGVISMLEQGTVSLGKLITRTVPPEEAASALHQWAEDPGKVMKILVKMNPDLAG